MQSAINKCIYCTFSGMLKRSSSFQQVQSSPIDARSTIPVDLWHVLDPLTQSIKARRTAKESLGLTQPARAL